MGRYLIRRLLQFIPVFFGATLLIFIMVWAIPGDPIAALAGDRVLPDTVRDQIRDRYNLDDPLIVQYGKYMGGVFQGDFGDDFRGRPVTDLLASGCPSPFASPCWPSASRWCSASSPASSPGCARGASWTTSSWCPRWWSSPFRYSCWASSPSYCWG